MVKHQWFGFVPLELYRQTCNPDYLRRGIELAEEQYHNADENGMPAYTGCGYVDDIYGATTMQSHSIHHVTAYDNQHVVFCHNPETRMGMMMASLSGDGGHEDGNDEWLELTGVIGATHLLQFGR